MNEWFARLEAKWPSFKYLGFGCYYAWILLCYNSSVLFPSPSNVAGFSAQSVMYLLSTLVLACMLAVCACCRRKATRLIARFPFVMAMGLVASASTVLVVLHVPQTASPVFYLGCAVTGFCTCFICLRFGMLYSTMEAQRAMANVAGAFVFACALYFVVVGLPHVLGLAVMVLLPLLAALCTVTYKEEPDKAAASVSAGKGAGFDGASHIGFFVKLVVAVGAFSTICGFYNGLGVNISNFTGTVVSAETSATMVFLVMVIAAGLLLVCGTVTDNFKVSTLYYPVILVACFAIVVLPLLGGYNDAQRIVIGAMYHLFILIVWCLLAHIANRTSLMPVFVFGLGRSASGFGTTIGWLASTFGAPQLADNSNTMMAVSVVMAFVLILISMVVLKEGAIDAVLEGTGADQAATGFVGDAAGQAGLVAPGAQAAPSAQATPGAKLAPGTQAAPGALHDNPWLAGDMGALPVADATVFHSSSAAAPYSNVSLVSKISPDNPNLAQAGLSDREIEVLGLLAGGNTIEGIANTLCVSFNTAKSHVRHVYTKLDVHSRKELMAYLRKL